MAPISGRKSACATVPRPKTDRRGTCRAPVRERKSVVGLTGSSGIVPVSCRCTLIYTDVTLPSTVPPLLAVPRSDRAAHRFESRPFAAACVKRRRRAPKLGLDRSTLAVWRTLLHSLPDYLFLSGSCCCWGGCRNSNDTYDCYALH